MLLAFSVTIILTSCYTNKLVDKEITKNPDLAIFGKKATYKFTPFTVIETFLNDSTLHWEMTNSKGVVAEAYEKVSFKQLSENLYFTSWIEKSGFTVSQIIDTKNDTVKAFCTFEDEKSLRGKRSSMFLDGKIIFDK